MGEGDDPGAMRPQARLVSVIVPHFDDLAGLASCLARLEHQSLDRDRYEIVVADNLSPQGEAAVAAVVAARARLVIVSERGAGPARNGGAAAARGDVLAFVDSDCLPDAGWLAAGVAALERFDVAGGRVEVVVADAANLTGAEAFECVFAFDNQAYVTRMGFTGSGNMFCRRSVFAEVGGFAVGVSEDVEWSRRARAAGFTLGYCDAAIVGHPARRNWPELRAKARKLDIESYGLWRARPGGRWLWLCRSLGLPVSILAHAPRLLASRRLTGGRSRVLGLATLGRVRLWRFAHSMALPFRRAAI